MSLTQLKKSKILSLITLLALLVTQILPAPAVFAEGGPPPGPPPIDLSKFFVVWKESPALDQLGADAGAVPPGVNVKFYPWDGVALPDTLIPVSLGQSNGDGSVTAVDIKDYSAGEHLKGFITIVSEFGESPKIPDFVLDRTVDGPPPQGDQSFVNKIKVHITPNGEGGINVTGDPGATNGAGQDYLFNVLKAYLWIDNGDSIPQLPAELSEPIQFANANPDGSFGPSLIMVGQAKGILLTATTTNESPKDLPNLIIFGEGPGGPPPGGEGPPPANSSTLKSQVTIYSPHGINAANLAESTALSVPDPSYYFWYPGQTILIKIAGKNGLVLQSGSETGNMLAGSGTETQDEVTGGAYWYKFDLSENYNGFTPRSLTFDLSYEGGQTDRVSIYIGPPVNPRTQEGLGSETTEWTEIPDFTDIDALHFQGMKPNHENPDIQTPVVKVSFLNANLNLTDYNTVEWLKQFGAKMESSRGKISLDAIDSALDGKPATVIFYDLPLALEEGKVPRIVAWEDGQALDTNLVDNVTFDFYGGTADVKDLQFTVGHFSEYRVAPSISIEAPLSTAIPDITVNGHIDDVGAEATMKVLKDGVVTDDLVVNIDENGDFALPLHLHAGIGAYTIAVTATNFAGVTTTEQVIVVLEAVASELEIVSPQDGQILPEESVPLKGFAHPDAFINVSVNGIIRDVPHDNGVFEEFITLQEGPNIIIVTATKDGLITEKTLNVTVDTIPPQVSITSPEDEASINYTQLPVEGTIEEGITGELYVNGDFVGNVEGTFSRVVELMEGDNWIEIRAQDGAGHRNDVARNVFVDTHAPGIWLEKPHSAFVTGESIVEVMGWTDDPSASIYINGKPCSNEDGLFIGEVALEEGRNIIKITAVDTNGNIRRISRLVYGDYTAPEITLMAPENGHLNNQGWVMLTGNTEKHARVEVYINDWNYPSIESFGKEYFQLPVGPLEEGENLIRVRVIDEVGNAAEEFRTVFFDRTPPALEITSPEHEVFLKPGSSPTITVEGVAEANSRVDVFVNELPYSPSLMTGRFRANVTLNEGPNEIFVCATDPAGNESWDFRYVYLDVDRPDLFVISPWAGQHVKDKVLIAGYTTDPEDRVQIYVDSVLNTTTGSDIFLEVPLDPAVPTHVINFVAVNQAGNTTEITRTVTIDQVAPVIDLASPAAEQIFNGEQGNWIPVSGTVDDPDAKVMIYANNSDVPIAKTVGTSFNKNIKLPEGANTITVIAVDEAGNLSNAVTRNVFLDTVSPEIVVDAPEDNILTKNATVEVSGFTNDVTAAVGITVFNYDGQVGDPVTTTLDEEGGFLQSITLPEGQNEIRITVVDSVGNVTTASRIINVDTTAPEVILNSPAGGESFNDESLEDLVVSGTVSDSEADVYINVYDGDGNSVVEEEEAEVGDGNFFKPITIEGEGQYTIEVYAVDEAGNESEPITRTISLDTVGPEIIMELPEFLGSSDFEDPNAPSVPVQVSTDDENAEIEILVNGLSAGQGVGEFSGLVDLNQGENVIVVRARDAAGNETEETRYIYVDTMAPTGTVEIIAKTEWVTKTAIKLSLSGDDGDNGSGIAAIVLSNSNTLNEEGLLANGNTTDVSSKNPPYSKEWTLTAGDGQKRVYAQFVDKAGNISGVYSDIVKLDTKGPSGSITKIAKTNRKGVLKLTISASDNVSGVYQMHISNRSDFKDGKWGAYSTSKEWKLTGRGTKTVYIRFKDRAGNVAGGKSAKITL